MIDYTLLYIAFFIKHFLADFPLQTQWMIREKGHWGKLGGIVHSGVHAILTVAVLSLFSIEPTVAASAGALDFVSHYHIDGLKMYVGNKTGWTPSDNQFWIAIGLDQLFHYLTYALIVHFLKHG